MPISRGARGEAKERRLFWFLRLAAMHRIVRTGYLHINCSLIKTSVSLDVFFFFLFFLSFFAATMCLLYTRAHKPSMGMGYGVSTLPCLSLPRLSFFFLF